MAQLKQDEWPNDNEPTTSEVEGDAFKSERPRPRIDRTRSSEPSSRTPVPQRKHDIAPPRDPS